MKGLPVFLKCIQLHAISLENSGAHFGTSNSPPQKKGFESGTENSPTHLDTIQLTNLKIFQVFSFGFHLQTSSFPKISRYIYSYSPRYISRCPYFFVFTKVYMIYVYKI